MPAKIKCHGHACPDRNDCPLYSSEKTPGDDEIGTNNTDCEMKRYYESKVRQ